MFCDIQYQRSDSLRRHYLAAHQLLWQHGQLRGATDSEIADQLEVLRRRQMSARRRRRLRASLVADDRWDAGTSSWSLAAAIRTASAPESWEEDCPPLLEHFTVPDLPELATVPPVSFDGGVCRDRGTVFFGVVAAGAAPPRSSESAVLKSEATVAVPPAVHWPAEVDYRAVVRVVNSRPDLSMDQLAAEVFRQFPVLDEQRDVIKHAVLGISWGLEYQARQVLEAAAHALDDPDNGSAVLAGLQARLQEQANRHY
jgi:hypothetical protein